MKLIGGPQLHMEFFYPIDIYGNETVIRIVSMRGERFYAGYNLKVGRINTIEVPCA